MALLVVPTQFPSCVAVSGSDAKVRLGSVGWLLSDWPPSAFLGFMPWGEGGLTLVAAGIGQTFALPFVR